VLCLMPDARCLSSQPQACRLKLQPSSPPPNQAMRDDVYSPVAAAIADILTFVDPLDAPAASSREEPQIRALIDAARGGSREAFGDLVLLYQRTVFRTALAALGAREDAEDATQEAFVVAWQKLPAFRGDSTFKTWLLTIVWRKALDRRRARKIWWNRTESARSADADHDPIAHLPETRPDPEQRTLSRDLELRIQQQIQRLSPKLRDALVLAASDEHTYGEIAAVLGIPLGTVKWRVSEARRVLVRNSPELRAGIASLRAPERGERAWGPASRK
jgi:RNA polymerase sigma-70 factor (ECF subfamily)